MKESLTHKPIDKQKSESGVFCIQDSKGKRKEIKIPNHEVVVVKEVQTSFGKYTLVNAYDNPKGMLSVYLFDNNNKIYPRNWTVAKV
ncbi:MAG: hypothetical protein KA140_08325 [Caldisericia bacterium]|nr:hypothetical protein [Caldisericia bacterium]